MAQNTLTIFEGATSHSVMLPVLSYSLLAETFQLHCFASDSDSDSDLMGL